MLPGKPGILHFTLPGLEIAWIFFFKYEIRGILKAKPGISFNLIVHIFFLIINSPKW